MTLSKSKERESPFLSCNFHGTVSSFGPLKFVSLTMKLLMAHTQSRLSGERRAAAPLATKGEIGKDLNVNGSKALEIKRRCVYVCVEKVEPAERVPQQQSAERHTFRNTVEPERESLSSALEREREEKKGLLSPCASPLCLAANIHGKMDVWLKNKVTPQDKSRKKSFK